MGRPKGSKNKPKKPIEAQPQPEPKPEPVEESKTESAAMDVITDTKAIENQS